MKFSKFLTSLIAVIIPMMILLAAFVIDAGVLFYRAFPEMPYGFKIAASAFLGFALAFPLLLTAVNSELLPKWKWLDFPKIFAVFTAVMTAMFFDVFQTTGKHWSWYVLVGFLSIGLGLIDWLYAYLFIRKYQLESDQVDYKAKYEKVRDTPRQLSEAQALLISARTELKEYKKMLTCPHCGKLSKSHSAHRNHVTRCDQNPKNQQS